MVCVDSLLVHVCFVRMKNEGVSFYSRVLSKANVTPLGKISS